MRVPFSWLKEWVDVPWQSAELGSRLTMAGFELEALDKSEPAETVLELNVTPNRGDVMSILGVAREAAALSSRSLVGLKIKRVEEQSRDTFAVHLDAKAACPKFAGRVIRGVNNRASTPVWMQERLRRCGVRSINPIVDVTNYVLLEMGQ